MTACRGCRASDRRQWQKKKKAGVVRLYHVCSDLHALLTRDPNANISCLDHVDVVGAIT